jgi:guanylate kinase
LSHIERGETVLKEMSVQGVQQMALNHKDILSNSFSIFLDLPDTKMIPRIVSRAHISEQELAGRLESAHIEREIAPTCCNKMISAD